MLDRRLPRSLALTLWLASAGAAASQEPSAKPSLEPEWGTERLSWSGPLESAGGLVVRNEFGDLRTRPTDDVVVSVGAVVQKRLDLKVDAEISVERRDGELVIEVRFPEATIEPRLLRPGVRVDRRVDLVVFVPGDTALRARTVDGLLEAKGLTADAVLETLDGDLIVRTRAAVDARTRHGSITAILRGSDWSSTQRFQTLTGDVRLELVRGLDAVATLSTRGEITTDYSIEIRRDGLLKTAAATLGAGGRRIRVESNKGGVKLLESIE